MLKYISLWEISQTELKLLKYLEGEKKQYFYHSATEMRGYRNYQTAVILQHFRHNASN